MKMRLFSFWLIASFLGVTGCGYFQSGTWVDSPKNWQRAFKAHKPAEVEVVHSKVWRSPHFTCEFEYFFQIRSNATFKADFFARNAMAKLSGVPEKATEVFFGEKPVWFIPKAADAYEVLIYRDEPRGNFRVFIDQETGDLFFTDNQV